MIPEQQSLVWGDYDRFALIQPIYGGTVIWSDYPIGGTDDTHYLYYWEEHAAETHYFIGLIRVDDAGPVLVDYYEDAALTGNPTFTLPTIPSSTGWYTTGHCVDYTVYPYRHYTHVIGSDGDSLVVHKCELTEPGILNYSGNARYQNFAVSPDGKYFAVSNFAENVLNPGGGVSPTEFIWQAWVFEAQTGDLYWTRQWQWTLDGGYNSLVGFPNKDVIVVTSTDYDRYKVATVTKDGGYSVFLDEPYSDWQPERSSQTAYYYPMDSYAPDYATGDPIYKLSTGDNVMRNNSTGEPTEFVVRTSGVYLTPHDPTNARNASSTYSAGASLYWCGALVEMQSAWQATYPFLASQQPNGPMTLRFYDGDDNPAKSTYTRFEVQYSSTYASGFSPADPAGTSQEDRLLFYALGADGSDIDGPFTLTSMWVPGQGWYQYSAMGHYGIRIEHQSPATHSPASFGVYGIRATLWPGAEVASPGDYGPYWSWRNLGENGFIFQTVYYQNPYTASETAYYLYRSFKVDWSGSDWVGSAVTDFVSVGPFSSSAAIFWEYNWDTWDKQLTIGIEDGSVWFYMADPSNPGGSLLYDALSGQTALNDLRFVVSLTYTGTIATNNANWFYWSATKTPYPMRLGKRGDGLGLLDRSPRINTADRYRWDSAQTSTRITGDGFKSYR